MYYTDRITGDTCIAENEEGKTFTIKLSEISGIVKEGSVLCEKDGVFSVDEEKTAERKKLLFEKRNKILTGKKRLLTDTQEILSKVDHTLLAQTASWDEIKVICDDGKNYKTASVCIPPSFVKQAKDYVGNELKICTVIGFPNGYNTTAVKCFETADAVKNGADEIDMVINIGWAKEHNYDAVLEEIKAVRKECAGKILKVIIETCLLTDEEKTALCSVVSRSGADYIKTSTGFSVSGATPDDIKLFAGNVEPHLKIKAAGGISSIEDAENFVSLGADRLGTSRIVKIVKNTHK